LLRAIQGELMKKPDRGDMVPGLGGVGKWVTQIKKASGG
jgi:hypothetical protein